MKYVQHVQKPWLDIASLCSSFKTSDISVQQVTVYMVYLAVVLI